MERGDGTEEAPHLVDDHQLSRREAVLLANEVAVLPRLDDVLEGLAGGDGGIWKKAGRVSGRT